MPIYAWVSPAFIKWGSPVDHTWVTSYDSRIANYPTIDAVTAAGENFWYCWGDFYSRGRLHDPIASCVNSSGAESCLVSPNVGNGHGTVLWYGIDGVCHQVSNQILYAEVTPGGGKPINVSKARGYKLSSALFGTYGRREAEWIDRRIACGVAPHSAYEGRRGYVSILTSRTVRALSLAQSDQVIRRLEEQRRELLADIDTIGFAQRGPNETRENRVDQINLRIEEFLSLSSRSVQRTEAFKQIFGIGPEERAYLVDPERFVFPDPTERPERNSRVGW